MRRIAGGAVVWLGIVGCFSKPLPPGFENVPDGFDNGYACACTCTFADGGSASRTLDACMTATDNPNLNGHHVPTAQALIDDCDDRVEEQVEAMIGQCAPAQAPHCSCVAVADTFYDRSCDLGCPDIPIDGQCANWDFEGGVPTATCADPASCDDVGPVCIKNVERPAAAAPSPVSARVLGRTTTCRVSAGTLDVSADGHAASATLAGDVSFTPAGCAGSERCYSLDYRLAALTSLAFDGVLGFGDTEISGITASGRAAAFPVGAAGTSFLAPGATRTSGRSFENGERRALDGENQDRVVVSFDGETCFLDGVLAGGVGDDDETADATALVRVSGDVVSSPPVARFDGDRTVECTSPDGAELTLDAGASTDREGDIVSYGWYLDHRAGPGLGTGPRLEILQGIGTTTYVLKVFDATLLADEATGTITVADTVPPVVVCNAPATITPRDTPYRFTATASDTCDDALAAPIVDRAECFAVNGSGRTVSRTCGVAVEGDTLVVLRSAGVGDRFRWRVRAGDADGNENAVTCETVVVPPGAR